MVKGSRPPLHFGGVEIAAGERRTIDLPVALLYTHTPLSMPVHLIHGRQPGPALFVSGVIHGDELIGLEIIRRLLNRRILSRLRGTLLAIPVVNTHGLLHRSRYLPDRRDLNRSFPGSEKGSLAARLANLFSEEVVSRCCYGIDLHSAGLNRVNLPQIRADFSDPETERLARVFGVPVLLDSQQRDGSLRQVAAERGVKVLLYEAGEALRFDELSIRAGVRGILAVLRALDMLPTSSSAQPARCLDAPIAHSSQWVRAPQSGIVRLATVLGSRVKKGQRLAIVADPFGESECEVTAPVAGIIIGRSTLPLTNEGEALFHIARFDDIKSAEEQVVNFQEAQIANPYDEPPL